MSHTRDKGVPRLRAVSLVTLVASLALWAGSCGDTSAPDRRPEVITALARDVAVGSYTELEVRSGTLLSEVEALCADPSDDTLQAARTAWWDARTPWKEAEVVKFGPVVEFPERFGPKLDSWPASLTAITELLTSDEGLTLADFALKGAYKRGLPVVEYLLYAQGDDTLTWLAADARRCEVLVGVTADVQANAGALRDAWLQLWQARLSDPTTDSADMWDTVQDVLDEWVNRMAFTVENIRSMKLGVPVGDTSGGVPMPENLESRYSGRSLRDARDALAGVARAWHGGDETQPGIAALLERKPALVERVSQLFVAADAALASVPEPLEPSLTDDRASIAAAQEALRLLQVALQTDVAQALGVTVTFNDNDGD
ncbi:MAG: imelysin family protein [Polyangiales bacterium]|nr:imelysin family protein [Myxococcales bacterium]